MTVDEAVQQVLTRLAEANNSPVAELPTGTGPSGSPAITTAAQIIRYLTEAQNELAMSPLLQLYGNAALAFVGGERGQIVYSAMTPDVADRVLWRPQQATWNKSGFPVTPVRIADEKWRSTYSRTHTIDGNNPPAILIDAGDRAQLLRPTVSATTSAPPATLTIEGLFLPAPVVAGGQFDGIPDVLMPHLIAFACWRVARQNAQESGLGAVVPMWRDEIKSWAASARVGK